MTAHGFIVSEEKTSKLVTLIVDKRGILGKNLLEHIDKTISSILVTAEKTAGTDTTIIIPFQKDIPEIPDGTYTHMFFVWEGKNETLHILEPLLEKAAADSAQFVFITDYHLFSEKLLEYLRQHYAQVTVVLLGDIFGNQQYGSLVSTMFYQAQKEGSIKLHNVGLTTVYPALFSDVVEKIVHVGFSHEKKKIYLAGYGEGVTQLSVAHILQKVEPFIKIDFTNINEEQVSLPIAISLFPSSYPLAAKLQDSFTDFIAASSIGLETSHSNTFSVPQIVKKQKTQKKKKRIVLICITLACLLFLLPSIITLIYAGLGGIFLKESVADGEKGNFAQAITFAATGKSMFTFSQETQAILDYELNVLALSSLAKTLHSLETTGNTVSLLLIDGLTAGESFSHVANGVSVIPSIDFVNGVSSLQHAITLLSQLPQNEIVDGVRIGDVTQSVQQFAGVLNVSSSLFGFPQKKTYVVLLQNNMELRPGGGFIGSYGIVTVDKGRISSVSLHDVYDADGQLKGHIEPPYVIRRYIPQVHWYLRDSNFDVDFLQDAKNAAFFLQEETGQRVDGVIGVDLSFFKDILALTGPVYVSEYNQSVTADNFFLLTEEHAEKNTFAGSSQKKDFLQALFVALQAKVAHTQSISFKNMMTVLEAIPQKHIVFGFSNASIQAAFTANGMSSTLWDGRTQQVNELLDFTGINEANIGINKANAYVTRQVTQTLALSQTGSVSGKLTITYTNTSKPNTWPGGPYKNYLRVILPFGAKLTSISIAGKVQNIVPAVTDASVYEAKNFVPPTGLEVDSSVEEEKQLYGFIVTIPAATKQTIAVTYSLSQTIDLHQPTFTYNMQLFKQPGVDGYPYTFSLTVPTNFSVLQTTGKVDSSGNSISYVNTFDKDTNFSAVFTQK